MAERIFQVGGREYREGQRVRARVIKARSESLTVQLEDKNWGSIRRENLPAEYRGKKCKQVVSPGGEVEATILGCDEQRCWFHLQLEQVLKDPWSTALKKVHKGLAVCGKVYNTQPFGAFVTLGYGISALIHFTEIPNAQWGRVDEVLQVGDWVEGVITKIDEDEREIGLSIRKHVEALEKHRRQTWIRLDEATQLDQTLRGSTVHTEVPEDRALQRLARPQLQGGKGRVTTILIVDDDQSLLEQRERWLKRLGYEVYTASARQQGIELAMSRGPDLALVDMVLPDIDGIVVAREILKSRPGTHVALTTGNPDSITHSELGKLEGVTVVSKLDGLQAIESLIAELESGQLQRLPAQPPHVADTGMEFLRRIPLPSGLGEDLETSLKRILGELREATRAQIGFVFRMDPATKQIGVTAKSGGTPTVEENLVNLRYSPVKDVTLEGEQIFERNVFGSRRLESKFTYLLSYLPFRSVIGLRIEAGKNATPYGLFLFHTDSDHFQDEHLRDALFTSQTMALVIRNNEVETDLVTLQKFAVAGQLTAGLLHELNNLLHDIEQSAKNLELDHADLTEDHHAASNENFLRGMKRSVNGVLDAKERLTELTRRFLGLIKGTKREEVSLDIHRIIEQAQRAVEPEAKLGKVKIKVLPDKEMPPSVFDSSRLEQCLVNLMLNAVQQIALHSEWGGILVVQTVFQSDDPLPIKIRYIDTGPGIHQQDIDRVFERGFSTRDGPGLGLFITRGLLQSMGGRVSVESSIIFVGSSFLVELPVRRAADE